MKNGTLHQERLTRQTTGRGLFDLTADVAGIVAESGVRTGLCTIFCRHTSASLVIQENADPSASRDLLAWLERIAPDGDEAYTHRSEGPDDMPAHLRSAVTKTAESIPVMNGRLALGTWQGLFLVEHRTSPHLREVVVHVAGSS